MFIFKQIEINSINSKFISFTSACFRVQEIDQALESKCQTTVNEIVTCSTDKNCDINKSGQALTDINKDVGNLRKEKQAIADSLKNLYTPKR